MNTSECFIAASMGDFTKQNFINVDEKWEKWAKVMNKLLIEEEKQKSKYFVTSNQKCE